MGKIKKTNADKTQQGSNRWTGPMPADMAKLCVLAFFLFFLVPLSAIGMMKKD